MRQTAILRATKHQVHVLHRLTRRALDQIVDDRQDHQRITALWTMHGNPAGIGRPHRARLGVAARRQDIDEPFAGVTLLEQTLKILLAGDPCI